MSQEPDYRTAFDGVSATSASHSVGEFAPPLDPSGSAVYSNGSIPAQGAPSASPYYIPSQQTAQVPLGSGATQYGYQQTTPPYESQPPYSYQQSSQSGYQQVPPYGYQSQPQPTYPQVYAVAPSKDHIAAGLLGIFLGGLGIHKFYLGYNTSGFIMLAVTLLGGMLTFGIASAVMGVIGLIEGILYLVKSQSEFEQTYVFSKREWF